MGNWAKLETISRAYTYPVPLCHEVRFWKKGNSRKTRKFASFVFCSNSLSPALFDCVCVCVCVICSGSSFTANERNHHHLSLGQWPASRTVWCKHCTGTPVQQNLLGTSTQDRSSLNSSGIRLAEDLTAQTSFLLDTK